MTARTKAVWFSLGLIAGVLLLSQLAFRDNDNKDKEKEKQKTAVQLPQIVLPPLPDEMDFAGEKVPLDRWEVREGFERELIYNYYAQGHLSYLLKLSKRYFPVIEERLKANGVPDDFKYLCVAEGNLQNLTSKVGAQGFWQFMGGTGPGYNLEINSNVDERYNVEKATDAACTYIKQAHNKFGNWTSAAASFNIGMGGYNSHSSFQGSDNYYDLALPDETAKYMYRILTFKYLMGNPKEMGYTVDDNNGYKPIKTRDITVTSTISNLAQWSKDNGSTYKFLKLLNPWLRERFLTVKPGKSYMIKLPAQ